MKIKERHGTHDKDSDVMHQIYNTKIVFKSANNYNESLHINLPPVDMFSDNKILKLNLVFGSQG